MSELVNKMDVKAQLDKAQEVGAHAAERYQDLKSAAPATLKTGLGKAEQASGVVAAKAKADPKRALLIVGGVLVVLLIVRRIRSHG